MPNDKSPQELFTEKKEIETQQAADSFSTSTNASPSNLSAGAVTLRSVGGHRALKAQEPLIIQSFIDGSSVSLRGSVSNVNLNWNSNWNEEIVYGRIDPIPTYSNTTREASITVQLVVPATMTPMQKLSLSKRNIEKLNVLANMCYPGYDVETDSSNRISSGVLKSSPLVKVKYGNVISGQMQGPDGEAGFITAYIKSLGVDFQADGLYSIGVGGEKYFRKISISLSFGILHSHNVGYSANGEPLVNEHTQEGSLEENTIRYPFNFKG